MQKYRPLKINLVLPQFTKYYSNDKKYMKIYEDTVLKVYDDKEIEE